MRQSKESSTNETVLTVVGGSYREACVEPRKDDLRGSGVRAAAILASLGTSCSFVTCIDRESIDELQALSHAFSFELKHHERAGTVQFEYETPISKPRWLAPQTPIEFDISATNVVAFGMLDANWLISAEQVVLDPQHSDLPTALERINYRHSLAIVLNSHEAYAATGKAPIEAGFDLLRLGADVVVVKHGALGGIVFHNDMAKEFGPIPTESVNTIGSGDAFTAGYAYGWFSGLKPFEAAALGARVAAAHSACSTFEITDTILSSLPQALNYPTKDSPKIYLAAPFFSSSQRIFLETVRNAIVDAGADCFSPLHEIGAGGDEVARLDLDGLESCDAVLALLDGTDPGTIFETGWATRHGIPVVGFAAEPHIHDWTMLRGSGATIRSDITTATYHAIWEGLKHRQRKASKS